MGDSVPVVSRNVYALPVLIEEVQSSHNYGKLPFNSHEGSLKYSIDFLVPEYSVVLAAGAGIVTYVKQDSTVGGPDAKYWDAGNRIVIRHANGEYSAYEHLRHNGSLVAIGQTVERGGLIGFSGNTGFSAGPHLHFEVFVHQSKDESEGETVWPRFAGGYEFEVGQVVTASELVLPVRVIAHPAR